MSNPLTTGIGLILILFGIWGLFLGVGMMWWRYRLWKEGDRRELEAEKRRLDAMYGADEEER